jgi:flavin reductase (DIM6/NTAB) family NADH-FMN oxidoreductase RutF
MLDLDQSASRKELLHAGAVAMGFAVLQPEMSRQQFIAAMRSVACSVSVVTTNGHAGRHGATVSAFASVSADPPSVLVCLRADSRVARMVMSNRLFCLNVLGQSARAVAERFAGRDDGKMDDRFAGIDFAETPGGQPALEGATAFCCRIEQAVPSGSHLVIIGRVSSIHEQAIDPLTYMQGGFHRVIPQNIMENAE